MLICKDCELKKTPQNGFIFYSSINFVNNFLWIALWNVFFLLFKLQAMLDNAIILRLFLNELSPTSSGWDWGLFQTVMSSQEKHMLLTCEGTYRGWKKLLGNSSMTPNGESLKDKRLVLGVSLFCISKVSFQ